MKKKIIRITGLLFLMLALCACSKKETSTDYNGYSEKDLQEVCLQTAETLEGLSDQAAVQYYGYYASQEGGEIYASLMEQWIELRPQIGGFVGYKDFEVTKAGKTITAVQTIAHEERDIILTYVFNAHSMEVTDITVQFVYTMGETMQKAGLNTIMGISIVFSILILISLVIYCFNIIPILQKKFSAKEKAEEAAPEVQRIPDRVEEEDETELIAVIAAAVAMETGMDTDDFVVRSVKRRY